MIFRENKRKGFTLIELLVVIAIIGLLSSVVFASLDGARQKARDSSRISDMRQVQTALELYFDAHGNYPPAPSWASNSCLTWNPSHSWFDVLQPLLDDGFLTVLPSDPLNNNGSPRMCYGYSTITGSHNNLQCAGVQMNNYEYVLEFSLENTTANFPLRGPAPGQPGTNHGYTYCIPGPVR